MTTQTLPDDAPWWRHLTRYQWFVFLAASGAWLFDCLDQRLFSLARSPAIAALAPAGADPAAVAKEVTAVFLVGWGIGGLVFGALGDRYGRARMLVVTVLLYAPCSAMCFFSESVGHFAFFRFLTGLGIGGVFGLAVAIVAEGVPEKARTGALAMIAGLSTFGNLGAPVIKFIFDELEMCGVLAGGYAWRSVFLVGVLPALLAIPVAFKLRESDAWLKRKAEGKLPTGGILASYIAMLRNKRWRRNLAVGAALACTGVIGLWGIGEYATDLQKNLFGAYYEAQGFSGAEAKAKVEFARNLAYVLQMSGGALGMWLFTRAATRFGRRPAFAVGFALAGIVTALVFRTMQTPGDAYWMMPLMGASQLGVFAGFAIYLPELFPTTMRGTGTSFCYNLGRFAAAAGSFGSAALAQNLYGHCGAPDMQRYAAMTMCVIFVVGVITALFAPETKGQPLPEDE